MRLNLCGTSLTAITASIETLLQQQIPDALPLPWSAAQ